MDLSQHCETDINEFRPFAARQAYSDSLMNFCQIGKNWGNLYETRDRELLILYPSL